MLSNVEGKEGGEGNHWTNNEDITRLLLFIQQTFRGIHYMAGRVSAGETAVGGSSYVITLTFPSCNFALFNFTTVLAPSTHQVGPVSFLPSHTLFSSCSSYLPSKLSFVVCLFVLKTLH